MKKIVLKLDDVCNDKCRKKAMKAVSGFEGVQSISVDMKDKKLTVTGTVDPVLVVTKLRKTYLTQIESVGPVK